MKKRPVVYLLIALFFAAAIIIIENPFKPRVDDFSFDYLIPDYDTEDVAQVKVSQLLDGAMLTKGEDGWSITEIITKQKRDLLEGEGRKIDEPKPMEGDSQRIESALGIFSGISKGLLVSKNPDNRGKYQVGPAGLQIAAFDKNDKKIFDLIIGKNGPDYTSTFVRKADEDKVYLIRQMAVGVFSPRATDWKKRKIEEEPKSK